MQNGRVTIIADNVPLRQILQEWARVGQTKIVNADKLTGPTSRCSWSNAPERDALDILLRSASGYIAAPRPVAVRERRVLRPRHDHGDEPRRRRPRASNMRRRRRSSARRSRSTTTTSRSTWRCHRTPPANPGDGQFPGMPPQPGSRCRRRCSPERRQAPLTVAAPRRGAAAAADAERRPEPVPAEPIVRPAAAPTGGRGGGPGGQ